MSLINNYSNKLPFIIGITGHRDPLNLKSEHDKNKDIESIKEKVKAAFKHWRNQFKSNDKKGSTNTPIWILSGMADGADLLAIEVAEKLWEEENWPKDSLKIIPCLPMDESAFKQDFSDTGMYSGDDFSNILDKYRANLIQLRHGLTPQEYQFACNDLSYGKQRNSLYLNLGVFIAKYSNVLIALWDGKHIADVGGTGDVVRYKCGLNPQWPCGTENKTLSQLSDFDGKIGGIVQHIPVNREKESKRANTETVLTGIDKKQTNTIFPLEDKNCILYISHQAARELVENKQADNNNNFLTDEFIALLEQLNEYNNQDLSTFDMDRIKPEDEPEIAVQKLSLKDCFYTFKCADNTAIKNQNAYRNKVLWFTFIAIAGFSSYELISTFLDNKIGIILNIAIIFAIFFNIVLRGSAKKNKLKWLYQLTRGVAESMRLRGFLNLANIPPTTSPLVPRRYRKQLPLLTHAIEVTELNWWKHPIQPQLESVKDYWLQGQIDFLKARLKLNEAPIYDDRAIFAKLLVAISPQQIIQRLSTFFYKRPAKTERTLSNWTTYLFIMTCFSILCLLLSQVLFFTGNNLPLINNTNSSMLMYPIQFTLLFTAIVALWNELSNYGPTANGYFNLLELYERAAYSLSKEMLNTYNKSELSRQNICNGLNQIVNTKKHRDMSTRLDTQSMLESAPINKQVIENLLIDLAKEAMQEHTEWNHYESISDLKNKK